MTIKEIVNLIEEYRDCWEELSSVKVAIRIHKIALQDIKKEEERSSWVCLRCGYQQSVGEVGFALLGLGFILCPDCKSRHFVKPDNTLTLTPY